jgi:hypothetical protein
MEELLEAVFSMRPVPRLYREAIWTSPVSLQSESEVGVRQVIASEDRSRRIRKLRKLRR